MRLEVFSIDKSPDQKVHVILSSFELLFQLRYRRFCRRLSCERARG